MVMKDLVRVGTTQIEEEGLLEKVEIQVEEMGIQTLMIVGMEMILHPHQTPHYPEEESIEGPDMFMHYKDLQGHQARKDNLDRQGERAEMGNPATY